MNKLLRMMDGSTESRRCTYVGAFGNVHVYTLDSKEDARVCFERDGVLWSIDFAERCENLCNYLAEHGHDNLVKVFNEHFETHKSRLLAGEYSLMGAWIPAYIGRYQEYLDARATFESIKEHIKNTFAEQVQLQQKVAYEQAKQNYISGEQPVEFEHLMDMCTEFGIDMAARTKGWFNQYVISVRYDVKTNSFFMKYSSNIKKPSSNASTVLFNLRDALLANPVYSYMNGVGVKTFDSEVHP